MPTDLILLVADKNIEYGMRGLLSRPRALGIRSIDFRILVHPQHDPGCANKAHDFLRSLSGHYEHALVLFDREGSGGDQVPPDQLAAEIRQRLAANGWDARAEAIVLDPELEVWVFAASRHVERCLQWNRRTGLRTWLEGRGMWSAARLKPDRPKEALEQALRAVGRPRSSSIYECLGRHVSVRGCVDPAFQRLRETLAGWFPPQASG